MNLEEIERRSRGLVLIHHYTRDTEDKQYKVLLSVREHRSGDLSSAEAAEFYLGGKYFDDKIRYVRQTEGSLQYTVFAWGPFHCTCRVIFQDGTETLLHRYVDFEFVEDLGIARGRAAIDNIRRGPRPPNF